MINIFDNASDALDYLSDNFNTVLFYHAPNKETESEETEETETAYLDEQWYILYNKNKRQMSRLMTKPT